jgi:hypothetical protein
VVRFGKTRGRCVSERKKSNPQKRHMGGASMHAWVVNDGTSDGRTGSSSLSSCSFKWVSCIGTKLQQELEGGGSEDNVNKYQQQL